MAVQQREIKSYNAAMGGHWLHRVNGLDCGFQARSLGSKTHALIRPFDVDGLCVSNVEASEFCLIRGGADFRRDNCDYLFAEVQMEGCTGMRQDGNCVSQRPGDLVIFDATRPVAVTFRGPGRQLSLPIPRALAETCLASGGNLPFLHVSGDSSLGRLAAGLVLEAVKQPRLSSDEGQAAMSALITLLKPRFLDALTQSPHDHVYRRTLALVDAHLGQHDLTPAMLAREVGVSARSLYRIFADRGCGLAKYIKERRLDFCADKLRRSSGCLSLSRLCFDVGFSNTSHFSTAFKKRFGVSPSQYMKRP